jgi:EAL domain-containing protein (putative c-di-GMP-specific phosphodiesterase class I)/GGDEF domain-containing protein
MKKLIFDNLIIITVIILLTATLAAFYITDFSAKARNEYGAVSKAKLDSVKELIEKEIDKGKSAVSSLDGELINVPDGYFAAAYIDDTVIYNDYRITLNTHGGVAEYTLITEMYERLISTEFAIYYSDSLFTDYGGDSESFAIFKKNQGSGAVLLFQSAADFFEKAVLYDFDNIFIISEGSVLMDYNGVMEEDTHFYDEIKENSLRFKGLLDGTESGIFSAEFGGNSKLFCFSEFSEGYKVVAYIDNLKEEAYIKDIVRNLIIVIASVIAAAGIFAFLLIRVYVRHFNTLVLLKRRKSLYVVYTNSMGVMKKANDTYKKEFDVFKIYENILDSCLPSFKVLQDCLPIIAKLKNKNGEEKYIIFFTIKTLRGYKLIGENATPLMSLYIENLKEIRQNENLGMYNMRQFYDDYRNIKKELRVNDGFYVLFGIRSITKYRSIFGEDFYNEILKKYAEILKEEVKEYGIIYYANYENFVLLITASEKAKKFKDNIKNFMQKLNLPLPIGKSLIKADFVAGLVELKGEYKNKTVKELNSLAEFSLEKAYELKNQYEIYDENKGSYYLSYNKKREITKAIIENNLIEVKFQPQYNIQKNKIVGFEALSRIMGKYEKELQIFEFIDIVERSGYMITLGDIVFNKVFEFARTIRDSNVTLSVNISPVQLLEAGFVKGLFEKIERYQIKKENIILEITETFLMTSYNDIITKLLTIQENGIKIHLDDFGVAYSSMLYLKKLPISTIKIDKAFVTDIINNEYSRTICKKIIELANELNLSVIAEGIENVEQLECLRQLGCKVIQGYYISPAVPSESACQLLEKYNGGLKNNV